MPKSAKKQPNFQILWDTARAVVLDKLTGEELFRLEHGRVGDAGAGFFEVQKGKKYGWLDSKGKVLMPIEFDQLITIWPDRRMIGVKNNLAGLFDMETGQELLPVMFRNLTRVARTFGHGAGFQIHHEKTWIAATKDLEIVGQKGPNVPIKKNDFQLSQTAQAVARADFEKAELPEIFTDFTPIMGEKWLHIFRSDGQHITSIETGLARVEPQFFSHNEPFLDDSNEIFTGFAKVIPATGKAFWVRLSDGLVYKNETSLAIGICANL